MEILFPYLRVLHVRRRIREKERRKIDYRSFVERRKWGNWLQQLQTVLQVDCVQQEMVMKKGKQTISKPYLLMLLPSFSLSPAAPVLVALSLPAKSTRLSLPTFSPDVWGRNQRTAPVSSLPSSYTVWCILQQQSNFIFGVNSCSNPSENGWIWTVPCARSLPAASETTGKSWILWNQVLWYFQVPQNSPEESTVMKCWTMKNLELCQASHKQRHKVHNPVLKTVS